MSRGLIRGSNSCTRRGSDNQAELAEAFVEAVNPREGMKEVGEEVGSDCARCVPSVCTRESVFLWAKLLKLHAPWSLDKEVT